MKKYLKKIVRWLILILTSIIIAIICTWDSLNLSEREIGFCIILMGLSIVICTILFIEYLGIGKNVIDGSLSGRVDYYVEDFSEIRVNIKKQKLIFSEHNEEIFQKRSVQSKRNYYRWRIVIFSIIVVLCTIGIIKSLMRGDMTGFEWERLLIGLGFWGYILFGLNKSRNTFLLINDFGIGTWNSGGSHRARIFQRKKVSYITINKDKRKIVVYKKTKMYKRKLLSFDMIAHFDLLVNKIYEVWDNNQRVFDVIVENE